MADMQINSGQLRTLCVVMPTYNEAMNISRLLDEVIETLQTLNFDWSIIVIDNDSADETQSILREIAAEEARVRLILNQANFGHIRSPYYGILQSDADATVYMASDFQDPPNLIPKMLAVWEHGADVVMARKKKSEMGFLNRAFRTLFYKLLGVFSETPIITDATGFGVYDRRVVGLLRSIRDPYPFLRGLIPQLGFKIEIVEFKQPVRRGGKSKNNLFTLYDIAMLGLVKQSRLPLRIVTFFGFTLGVLSFLASIGALITKLLFWNQIQMGMAPLAISVFFLFGALFFVIGMLAEYVLVISDKVKNHPIVVEKERVNFDP